MIEVTNLSSITDTESFRVDGLGNAKLLVVQCTLDRRPEIPESDPIRDLKSQLGELQTEKGACEQEVAILKAYGKTMADKPGLTTDQANAFSDTLYDKILTCAETVRGADEKITQLNQKINQMQSSRVGAAHTKAMITILADEDGPAQLRLIYREWWCSVIEDPTHLPHTGVLSARWAPLYDLYATSEDGKPSPSVSLHYRVNLSQDTGEDWTSAKLTLSTSATDVLNAGIPRPDDLIIKPPTPEPVQIPCSLPMPRMKARKSSSKSPNYMPGSPSEQSDEDMGFGLFDGDDTGPLGHYIAQLAQSTATISKSPMTVSYTVDALTTIPSDGLPYKVLVATVPFEAVITHITTPRKSPIAYLQVRKCGAFGSVKLT